VAVAGFSYLFSKVGIRSILGYNDLSLGFNIEQGAPEHENDYRLTLEGSVATQITLWL